MGRSIDIEKQAIIERINEIDDVKILEKLRKTLFKPSKVKEMEPCVFSNEEVKTILEKQRKEKKARFTNSQVVDMMAQW